MRIAVDGRHLTSQTPSGVGRATMSLLCALCHVLEAEDTVEITTVGSKDAEKTAASFIRTLPRNVLHTHWHIPNRLVHASILAMHSPRFENLCQKRPDIIWLPNLHFFSTRCPYVLSVHDLSFFLNPLWFTKRSRLWHQWVQPRHLIEYAAHIVAPSETTTQDILHFFGKDTDQITTIPHPMDPAFSEKRQPQDDGIRSKYRLPKKFLLHVGTWEPRKNIDGLLAALSAEQMPIVFVGSRGNAKSVPESARPLVRVLNYVPQEDLPSIYRSATALIFPSFYEGYGLPIVEAFASGTPVVTSAHSATREVAGDAAILIDPRRPNEIATAIHTIVNNNPLRRGLIASGLKRAHTLSRNHSGRALYQALKASATQNS